MLGASPNCLVRGVMFQMQAQSCTILSTTYTLSTTLQKTEFHEQDFAKQSVTIIPISVLHRRTTAYTGQRERERGIRKERGRERGDLGVRRGQSDWCLRTSVADRALSRRRLANSPCSVASCIRSIVFSAHLTTNDKRSNVQ